MNENNVDSSNLIYRCYDCKQILEEDDKYSTYCLVCLMSKW